MAVYGESVELAVLLARDGVVKCSDCGKSINANVANLVSDERGDDRLVFAREEAKRFPGWDIAVQYEPICGKCANAVSTDLLAPLHKQLVEYHNCGFHGDMSPYWHLDCSQCSARLELTDDTYSRMGVVEEATKQGWRMIAKYIPLCPDCLKRYQ